MKKIYETPSMDLIKFDVPENIMALGENTSANITSTNASKSVSLTTIFGSYE